VKRFFLLASILFIITCIIETYAQPSGGVYFTTAFPVGEFSQFDTDAGFGGNLEIFFFSPSSKRPFGMGVSLSYFAQGLFFYNDPYTDELILSNNRANNFSSMHLVFQVASSKGHIRLYFETLFGGSYIFSYSTIYTTDYIPEDLYVDDWAWSYGLGGGLKFLISDDFGSGRGETFIDLKVRYLFGSEVSYLDRNSIRYANDTFEYSLNQSNIDILTMQIGVIIAF
jgi:hypothetical protein